MQIQLFYYTFGSWFFLHDATSSEIEAAYAVGGLPPVRNSAAMVSKCEKTICKSLTVWPLWWLAWIAGKAGAWSTVWRHLGRLQSFRQQSCFCVCDKVCGLHPLAVNGACEFLQKRASGFHSHPVQTYFSHLLHSQVLHSWSTCLCQGVWSPPPCCARACAFLQTWASGFHSHPVQIYFSNLLHSQVLHFWSAGLCQGVWSSPPC